MTKGKILGIAVFNPEGKTRDYYDTQMWAILGYNFAGQETGYTPTFFEPTESIARNGALAVANDQRWNWSGGGYHYLFPWELMIGGKDVE